MARVVITGGAGAIGSNLVRALLRESVVEVVIVDDLSSGHEQNIPRDDRVLFLRGSILDQSVLDRAFNRPVERVFHLAANFANLSSVHEPEKDLLVNGLGTLRVLGTAHRHGVRRFVYASSSCVYGGRCGALAESMQEFNPGTPYAATKLLGERYVEFFSRHHGLDAVIVRYFNTYGPGELPGRYRNVIPNFFYSAMKSQELRITGSGEETRDFNFVEDTVAGTIRASEIASSGAVYNIGSGRETTILTVATRINQIVGNPAGIEFVEERKWDTVPRRLASIERAVSELGYRPAVGIDEGLQKTYEWLKEQDLTSCFV